MRVVLQRVAHASVVVDGEITGRIDLGLLLFAAFADADAEDDLAWMARKCVDLRVFNDDQGKMNRSLLEVGGGILLVSQFTLYGDARKGRRPSYIDSAEPARAQRLYDRFGELLEDCGVRVATGRFGAHMEVSLLNDGPVTLILDRP